MPSRSMLNRTPGGDILSDAQILAALQSGNADVGCKALVQQHFGRVRTFLRSRYPEALPDEIHDAATNAVVTIWKKAHDYDPARGTLGGWLFAIARNELLTSMRTRLVRRFLATLDGKEVDSFAAVGAVECSERKRALLGALDECIERLPHLQRSVVSADLAHGSSVDGARLAMELESTVNAVHAARCKARGRLRECLEKKGFA